MKKEHGATERGGWIGRGKARERRGQEGPAQYRVGKLSLHTFVPKSTLQDTFGKTFPTMWGKGEVCTLFTGRDARLISWLITTLQNEYICNIIYYICTFFFWERESFSAERRNPLGMTSWRISFRYIGHEVTERREAVYLHILSGNWDIDWYYHPWFFLVFVFLPADFSNCHFVSLSRWRPRFKGFL